MPIYEFVCEACGRITEVMQKVSDPAPAACPECGGGKLARLVSRTTFQLKGGGWYSDLYASAKSKPAPAGQAPAGAGAAPAAPAKAEPAAAPAAPAAPGGGKGGA
ncbi:FmdB family zinc ribbon protein [Anaeromyxobacter sp. Red801]|uniref:FmdB family zinc ribbon protein n=1 Tax=Anaeromyxobacter sp. Red801 TaxID=3411632 RepID=UPI003BA1287A